MDKSERYTAFRPLIVIDIKLNLYNLHFNLTRNQFETVTFVNERGIFSAFTNAAKVIH